ncbi:DUF3944 domain-containing protein [Helicobacter sp. UBA3407]|uniref:DUF3944 domain-containing protein n=2 Tax=Helicobacter TaxID=209 RepID=UPI00260442DD|nr:DUF3944 domain-containing protein [Helicobacter sp. UBA3407]
MAYRYDQDLEFLREKELSSQDLNDLVEVLTGEEGDRRLTEMLTQNDLYKRFYPNHKEYLDLVLEELQCFGGNTIINILRGGGVLYKEILCDVCDKLKVNYDKKSPTELIEQNMFMKLAVDVFSKMDKDEVKKVAESMNVKDLPIGPELVAYAQLAFRAGGFKSYQMTLIVANYIWKVLFGHGLRLTTNASLTRILSILAGPIGLTITALWTVWDIAGAAYRVTVPAVIQVAFLRQTYKEIKSGSIKRDNTNN